MGSPVAYGRLMADDPSLAERLTELWRRRVPNLGHLRQQVHEALNLRVVRVRARPDPRAPEVLVESDTGERWAVERIRVSLANDLDTARSTLEGRADAMAQLAHSALPKVKGLTWQGRTAYLTMGERPDSSLPEVVRLEGPSPVAHAARTVAHLAAAISVVHAAGLAHGALHPAAIQYRSPAAVCIEGWGEGWERGWHGSELEAVQASDVRGLACILTAALGAPQRPMRDEVRTFLDWTQRESPSASDWRTELVRTFDGLASDLILPPPPPSLPQYADGFVGRRDEVDAMKSLLEERRVPLVTLVGPAGVGKTRLAVAWAWSALKRATPFVAATWVDLSDVPTTPGALTRAVARALGLRGSGDLSENVSQELRRQVGPGRMLVLDNAEHQVEPLVRRVKAWRASAPELSVVVTSRRPLGMPEEHALPVAPLPHEGRESEAAELFFARANWTETSDEEALLQLMQVLEGLPLAIELAASRARVMPLADLVRRIHDRLDVLSAVRVGQPARHQSLRAAFDVSWDTLTAPERDALAQLTVFDGGFTLRQAEAVVETSGPGPLTLDLVQRLADHSLLRVAPSDHRLSMLMSVRRWASHHLASRDPDRTAQARHARCFAEYGSPESERQMSMGTGPDPGLEVPNLRAALAWARSHAPGDAVRLGIALATLAIRHGPTELADDLGSLTTSPEAAPEDVIRLLDCLGHVEAERYQMEEANAVFDRAAGLAKAVGHEALRLRVDVSRATALVLNQDHRTGVDRLSALIDRCRAHGHAETLAFALVQRADSLRALGRYAEAFDALEETLALCEVHEMPRIEQAAYRARASVCMRTGNLELAESMIRKAIDTHPKGRGRWGLLGSLLSLSRIRVERGALDDGEAVLDEASALLRETGVPPRLEELVLGSRGKLALRRGDHATAEAYLIQAREAAARLSNAHGEAVWLANLSEVAFARGAIDTGIALCDQALPAFEASGDLMSTVMLHATVGLQEVQRDRKAAAHRFRRVAEVLRRRPIPRDVPSSQRLQQLADALGRDIPPSWFTS